jgi:hypothetical protein
LRGLEAILAHILSHARANDEVMNYERSIEDVEQMRWQ